MGVVYLNNGNEAWAQGLGNLLGAWVGKRMADIQRTHEAKNFANSWFPDLTNQQQSPQEDGKTMQDYLPKDYTPVLPKMSGGLLAQALHENRDQMQQANGLLNRAIATPLSPAGGYAPSVFQSPSMETTMNVNPVNMSQENPGNASGGQGVPTIPTALKNAAEPYITRPVFNTQADTVPKENSIPSVPNRESVRKANMASNGSTYRDLYVSSIKAGYTPEEARTMTMERVKQDEDTAFSHQQNEYVQKVLNPLKEQILNQLIFTQDENGNSIVDTYHSGKLPGLIPAINRYNEMATAAGASLLDINSLSSISKLNKPDYAFMQGKNGHIARVNKDTGVITDGGDFSDPRDRFMQSNGGFMDVKTGRFITDPIAVRKIQIEQQRADANDRMTASNISMNQYKMTHPNASTSSGANGQLTNLVRLHTAWMKNNPDQDESASPYYGPLMSALPAGGGSSGGQQDPVDARIDALREQGWSPERIIAGLKASGNDAYVSHVW